MDILGVQSVVELQKDIVKQNNQVANTEFSDALEKAMSENDTEELKESCKQIESYMLSYVFKQMKNTMLTGDTLLGKGDYEEMFEDTMIEAMCENMVEAGGIGLADSMYKQMVDTYKAQQSLKSDTQINNVDQNM